MNGLIEEKKPLLLRKTLGEYESVMGKINPDKSMHVIRPIYQQDDLNRDTLYEKPTNSVKEFLKRKCRSCSATECLLSTIPVLKWMPEYNWRKNIMGDIISGLTVAVMHIPQGMAYGLLGGVDPVVGIYMAFFPVLIYFFFGTSRHVSMGTFAIVCLMTGKVVSQHSPEVITYKNGTTVTVLPEYGGNYTNIQVALTVTFTVAIIQLLMYFLRLGIVATLLSETLVSGFTSACAFHVISSQLKDLLGLPIQKRRGFFRIVYVLYDAIMELPKANRVAVSISLVTCVTLSITNEIFKPWLSKKTRIPFPIELAAVVVGTAVSYFCDFNHKNNISIIGHIPTGLPEPALPSFELIPSIFLDCFVIMMVSYSISMSMALIFAQKHHYEVNSNQELLALSFSNLVGSAFHCMPLTASLSRSMIQEAVGGVSQLASIVSCSIILMILLWIGPFFETLPRCVLASIIVVALKGMVTKTGSFVKYCKLSKWDGVVWFVTFVTTLLVDISIGLGVGVLMSLLSVFVQGYTPYSCLLEIVPNTDLYLDKRRYKGTQAIPGIKIFHYSGGLSFASKASFRSQLYKMTGFDPNLLLIQRKKMEESTISESDEYEDFLVKCIVLDFSAVTFVDPSGVTLLRNLQNEYSNLDVALYIAACSGPVFETFKRCDKYEGKESKFMIFPTIHDAVCYAQSNLMTDKIT